MSKFVIEVSAKLSHSILRSSFLVSRELKVFLFFFCLNEYPEHHRFEYHLVIDELFRDVHQVKLQNNDINISILLSFSLYT